MFKTTTKYGMTVTSEDKINYYNAMAINDLQEKDTPETLEEAVDILIEAIPIERANELLNASRAHFSLGRFLRNYWGLWSGSKLQEWFHEKGIRHADDMSGIILESAKRELNGDDWELDKQIQYYREYWKGKDVNPDEIGKGDEQE